MLRGLEITAKAGGVRMAFFSDVARELIEVTGLKRQDWEVKTDRDLYRYAQYGYAIKRQLIRLEELREGRRLIAVYERREGQKTAPSSSAVEEKIVQEILEIEKRIKFYQEFRETIELAIDYAWQDREHKKFIELYWWSGLPKTQARNLVMHEMFLSRRTFYRWREEILFRMAQLLGYLPPR